MTYYYDSFKRPTQILRWPPSSNPDPCQQTNIYYETNPFDGSFSQNSTGRKTAEQWGGPGCPAPYQFTTKKWDM